ncbi:ParB family protein [Aromatoleum toluclasticum]|uniref:ParB family protein n=1 Tax=Aromatoleum toluclasticum TaxID=92003 RepID=UPI001D187290|nr:ParB family protein [Aromatoleum toluclasticum]MCC4113870.1 ParB family protein [Aromatoleum toluclasticum]
MAEITPRDMADKLLAAGFQRTGPAATALSDPIADTPMIVTLDQLRPYDHDPRVKRNPAYEEIKASIRERGLDAAPAITRRPGGEHFIIRNGGNTRLAILRELWAETKQERFFRISCLFRPWPERGEIVALTGHLAENELRGGLTFIERALGVEKACEFYEQETGSTLTQSELARRLTGDGYPVQQSHISRMQDAVRYLLPAIPAVLYGGLGRHQVERLAVLRKACERIWERRAPGRHLAVDFATLFQDVLSQFDTQPDDFSFQRVQDELVGQMAEFLEADYDALSLEIDDSESRQRALTREPAPASPAAPIVPARPQPASPPPAATPAQQAGAPAGPVAELPPTQTATALARGNEQGEGEGAAPAPADRDAERLQGHIVSPALTTERLQSIQRLVADQMGDKLPDFEANALRAIPVQVGGLYPISDVWYIEPGLDGPDRLRVHIAQFAREIAEEAAVAEHVEPSESGIGFICVTTAVGQTKDFPAFARAVLTLLHALSAARVPAPGLDRERLANDLAPLLRGGGTSMRLSDAGLVKLFRLLRLARRLLDLETGVTSVAPGHEP